MRGFAAALLCFGLAASPLLANDAKEAVTEGSRATETVKREDPAIEVEIQELRSLVEEQRTELESQRAMLKAQQVEMDALVERLGIAPLEPVAAPAVMSTAISLAPAAPGAATPSAAIPARSPRQGAEDVSPLQLRIGSAYITPVGFMDFTSVWRSHDGGSGIGTSFAGIPYGNVFQNHLSEFRLSMQNSRIGFRVDAMVKGAHVIGYMESDYLGNNPGNVAVSSNSNTVRSRLYWVDVQKGKWEVLGGQTWSLITPGRSGISPLPGNLFFSQNIDVNYQLGLVWGRIPEARFVYHPTNKVAFAVALDSPEQYTGGSAGGATITYPTALSSTTAGYPGLQLNTGGSTLGTPNVTPDIIAKLAFDPSSRFHAEIGGVERQFKVWNPNTGVTFQKTGGGGFVNLNFELFKSFRLLTNNYWSDGGGRYIFGQAPDLIVRADGSISPIKSGSTVSGFEYTYKNTLFYAYYGGMYVQRNTAFDTNGTTPVGYGYATSPSSQNRAVQEETFGFNQTMWKDGKYGALNLMGQYSYLERNPWATLNPKEAHLNMVFLNLRYTLPGSAPAIK